MNYSKDSNRNSFPTGGSRRLIVIITAGLIVCGVALAIRLNAPSALPPEWVQLQEKLEQFRRAGFHPQVALPEPFDPITEFPVKSAEEADAELDAAELVLGVTVNG